MALKDPSNDNDLQAALDFFARYIGPEGLTSLLKGRTRW